MHYLHQAQSLPLHNPCSIQGYPNGPWQEITADYLTHKGKEYLLICNLFSKYPFLSKVTSKSAHSLSQHLHELISQYRPPSLIYTDNWAPFHHLMSSPNSCSTITLTMSPLSPHFPQSNGFIEHQVRTIKTMLNTTQDTGKSLEELLLDLYSTPIGSNMPSPQEILHNRTFQHPWQAFNPSCQHGASLQLPVGKEAEPEAVLWSCPQMLREQQQLSPGQEVLFLSPAENEYIHQNHSWPGFCPTQLHHRGPR